MKRTYLIILAILITNLGLAQSNTGFNYKALITENGNALVNHPVNIRFTLTYTGTVVYKETHSTTTDANGIVNVNIGEGTPITGDFSNIYWPYYHYLKVEIDTGNGYQVFSNDELRYVYKAKYADRAGHVEIIDNIQGIPVSNTTPTNGQVLKYNGTQFVPADDDTGGGSGTDGVVNSATFSGTTTKTLTLGRSNGLGNVTATFTDAVNDADHSTTNELQNLTLNGTQLSLSNGNNVNFTGWDTDASDDFSGDLLDLDNVSESNNSYFILSDNYTNTGTANYAIGVNALHSNTSGGGNISLGYNNLYDNTSGSNNIALGSASLGNNTTGEANIAIGTQALYENSTTNNNIAIGIGTLKFYTGTGYAYTGENVAIGDDALKNLHSGVGNTVIGANAADSGNTGSRNVYIGYNAATNATGSDNIFIGHSAGANETGSNKLYIENSNSSSPLIYGEFDNDLVKINGTLQVSDGSQGNGKVLTSDASGVASWQTPATFTDLWSSNGSNIYRNNGNVGIGTSTPNAPLEIRSDASASLIIGSYSPNYNIRPGIQFKNNTSQYIAGDDGSNEIFGFYSKWGNSRTYDAKLRIYGKASGSWGKYIEITHDGSDASIKTDTGNISLEPSGGEVQVNGKITAPATGSNDMKAFAYGTIDSNGSILSGTGNFHVDHNLGAGIYKISFTGENYDDSHFTTVVSVHDTYWPSFIFCYATNNTLVVKIFDADGTTKENMPFSFVTYKK